MKTGERSGFLGVWPVVRRELREGARRPFNHWLRILSALAGMALLYVNLAVLGRNAPEAAVGAQLFSSLHTLLLTLICCIVPTMTADCIAREKREGTLGLLFLTGLTPAGIVVGKSLVQGFRAFTLWVAVLPILTIPFLTGGVGWTAAIRAVAVEFCAAVLCLAAGLLASTLAKVRAIAFALALTFALVFVVLFSQLTPFHFFAGSSFAPRFLSSPSFFVSGPGWQSGAYYYNPSAFMLLQTPAWGMNPALYAQFMGTPLGRTSPVVRSRTPGLGQPLIAAGSVALALLIFVFVVLLASRRVANSWKDKIPTAKRAGLVRRYCTPLFRGWLGRRMRRSLDKNPIAWLQQYSWKARMSKWGLCVAFVILECFMVAGDNLWEIQRMQSILVIVLAAVFTFVGVNSFLEEKKTGALELILITPLSVNQIIRGRVWGLWKQFLPAALVLAGFYISAAQSIWALDNYYTAYRFGVGAIFRPLWFVVSGYLVLPVFATYFALRVKNMIVAGVLTWMVMALAPAMGFGAFDQVRWHFFHLDPSPGSIVLGVLAGNAAFAALVCFLLRHSLSRRIYSF
jgi:ABC-type transport system involved in multi-copper enzyme maturation permease subunit